ncbi:trypco2 family protein [Streptomyces griseus]|uniref:trypco2 family protein n=1 Tax=Streptomyces griseus TaxID=1911 RepID=UPI0004C6BFD7|nr:trypco2 family protein [Streptomyces griseus]
MGIIGLAQAVEQLRQELGEAQDAGSDQQLRFEIDEVELELQVELTKGAGPQGKVTFGIVSVGGDAKVERASTHRLLLRLTVRDEALGGERAKVSRDQEKGWDEEDA